MATAATAVDASSGRQPAIAQPAAPGLTAFASVTADVVAFDLSVPARVFGHVEERDRYAFSVCAERPGLVSSTTGFWITVANGLQPLRDADTVVVPGIHAHAATLDALLIRRHSIRGPACAGEITSRPKPHRRSRGVTGEII
jgi:transcriptional regulator GlxA family with amidase domain